MSLYDKKMGHIKMGNYGKCKNTEKKEEKKTKKTQKRKQRGVKDGKRTATT